MMRRLPAVQGARFACLSIGLLCWLLPGAAVAQQSLTVKNLEDTPIAHVYLSQKFDAFGEVFKDTDQLKGPLGKGESVKLDTSTVSSFLPQARCFLNIRVVFGDGSSTTRTNQNICELGQQNFAAPGTGTATSPMTFFTNQAAVMPTGVFVRPAGRSNWWEYKDQDSPGQGQPFKLRVRPEDGCQYDFRVQFSGNREVEVDNTNICRLPDFDVYEPPEPYDEPSAYSIYLKALGNLKVPITGNPPTSPPKQDDLALVLKNTWRLPLRAMFVRPPDPDKELATANFETNLLKGMDVLLPHSQVEVKLPAAGCKWDVLEVYQGIGHVEQFGGRQLDVCGGSSGRVLESAGPVPGNILSYGSGFLVSGEGHIVTNAHVTEACGRVTARGGYNQDEIPLRLIAQNQLQDLALLQIVGGQTPTFALRDPVRSPPQQAEPIIVMGFPEPIKLGHQFIPTPGSLGGLKGANGSDNYYMVEASLRPGDSGGPITDAYGLVIGVNEGYMPGDSDTLHFGVQVGALLDWLRSLDVPVVLKQPEGAAPANQDVVSRSRAMVQQLLCYS